MEERICKVSKEVWAAMMEAMPPEARASTYNDGLGVSLCKHAIVLNSPFGYRLFFVYED